ncbi:MAG TPA: substrate-binding domain-containing protein [Rudaea sp.]|nr:substrate-binding domain-containing protein [Rudaea sp.]
MNYAFLLRCAALGLALSTGAALAQTAPAAEKPATPHKKTAAPAKPATPPAETIVWRGDHCTARVVRDLVKQYEAGKQGKVTLQPFSTISGLDAVSSGTADLAGSARPAMLDRPEEKSINFHPVAWDALVPIVSAKNPVSNITLKQLHDLYLGRLTDWQELGGPPGEINLYAVAGPLDGIEYSTRLLLFHAGDQDVSVPRLYVNTEKLEEGIAIDPHGLGMSTLSGVAGNPAIKMLSVEGVAPSTASVADGTYPLYSALYFAARDDDPHHDAVDKFIRYIESDQAKTVLRKHALVPYSDAPGLIEKQDQRVAFIDAHVRPEAVAAAASAPAGGTPVSAPNATAQALERVAPTSELTAAAKERAARAAAEKAAKTQTPDAATH